MPYSGLKTSGRLLKALRAACLYELSLRAFYAQAQALHPVLAGSSIQACQISIDGHGVVGNFEWFCQFALCILLGKYNMIFTLTLFSHNLVAYSECTALQQSEL